MLRSRCARRNGYMDRQRYNCFGHAATGSLRRIDARLHSVQARGQRQEINSHDHLSVSGQKASTSAPAVATHFTQRKARAREGV